jgi:hypothetical protein
VKASCPICGDVEFGAGGLRLIVCSSRSRYEFTCPTCREHVSKPANADVIRLLILGGVEPENVPAEALEVHEGPPIGQRDVDRFLALLAKVPDDMIAATAAA